MSFSVEGDVNSNYVYAQEQTKFLILLLVVLSRLVVILMFLAAVANFVILLMVVAEEVVELEEGQVIFSDLGHDPPLTTILRGLTEKILQSTLSLLCQLHLSISIVCDRYLQPHCIHRLSTVLALDVRCCGCGGVQFARSKRISAKGCDANFEHMPALRCCVMVCCSRDRVSRVLDRGSVAVWQCGMWQARSTKQVAGGKAPD